MSFFPMIRHALKFLVKQVYRAIPFVVFMPIQSDSDTLPIIRGQKFLCISAIIRSVGEGEFGLNELLGLFQHFLHRPFFVAVGSGDYSMRKLTEFRQVRKVYVQLKAIL